MSSLSSVGGSGSVDQLRGLSLDATSEPSKMEGSSSSKRPDSIAGQSIPSSPRQARAEGTQNLAKDHVHLRRLSAVGVGVLTALRSILAVATLGISEGAVSLVKHASNCWGTKPTTGSVDIQLPGGGTVKLQGSSLPKRIPSGMTMQDLQSQLQAKVTAGHTLVDQLTHGTHDGSPCTLEDMTNIMWFLQVKGEAAKGHFDEGAFSIEDPGQNIRKYLDSCPEAYQRESSHVGKFQSSDGGRHRGIDAYGSGSKLGQLLPNNMKTLLYGSMASGSAHGMPTDRLFLKMESHGAYLTSPKGGGDVGGPRRYANIHDAGAILGHTFSFIATRGKGSAAGTFKERIPDSIQNKFKALVQSAPDGIKAQLNAGTPLSKDAGIRVMLKNVTTALQGLPSSDPLHAELTSFKDSITGAVDSSGRPKYDHLESRIGNEVILDTRDMFAPRPDANGFYEVDLS